MDETERNENELGSEPQWDNTYGKKSLPQVNDSYGLQNTLHEEQNWQNQNVAEQISSFGPPVQPYLPPGKSHKKGILIAASVTAALLSLCVGIGWISHINSASYKLKKGFENMDQEWARMRNPLTEKLDVDEIAKMMAEDGSHVNTRLNVTMDTYGLGKITLGVDTDYYKDVHQKQMDARTSLSIMNYDFAHFNFYGDEDVVCFSIPELFLEDIYIENEDVTGQFNRSMWADSYLLGEMEEEHSINLFPDKPRFEAVHDWQELRAYLGTCSEHLEECLQGARIEKAGKGVYRVTFDALEVNYLLRDILLTYEDMTGQDMYDILSCLQLVSMGDDISFLIKIGGGNRIRSITLEEPVSILDNQFNLKGEILFQGRERSIDLIRGQIALTNEEDEELELTWQADQSLSADKDVYRLEGDMKCKVLDEELDLKYSTYFDAQYDEFQVQLFMKDGWSVYRIIGKGRFDEIRPGQGYQMDLEDLSVSMDGEELFNITGDIHVEPLRGNIKRSVEARTAFFEMTERDWNRILDRIDEEYGGLFNMLP